MQHAVHFRTLLQSVNRPLVIGMVHLRPLPGTPGFHGSLAAVREAAVADADALTRGGVDAIMVENYGDVPFRKRDVEPHTIAAIGLIADEIRRTTGLPLGINVLRNDAAAAIGIASVCGAVMVRVNVHTGAMLTDQGVIEGDAAATLAYRSKLGTDVAILADINVKHARPLAPFPIEEAAADAVERGLADGLIVTGTRTGGGVDPEEPARVRRAVRAPIFIGSGVTEETLPRLVDNCDGMIVGSWFKEQGVVSRPVDRKRVEAFMERIRKAE